MPYYVCCVGANVKDAICCNSATVQHNVVHINWLFKYLLFAYVLFHKDCMCYFGKVIMPEETCKVNNLKCII